MLRRFELERLANEYAGSLSGGQKRLVELMRALMASPKLLLLDEPMAGVNPTLALSIAEHLEELRDEGMTMLMVEHELRWVEKLCDPIVVMARGSGPRRGLDGGVAGERAGRRCLPRGMSVEAAGRRRTSSRPSRSRRATAAA